MSATIIVSIFLLLGTITISNINAQTQERVTISVDSATFLPLTTYPGANQLKVIVAYQTSDPEIMNTQINGVMQVIANNGTIVKYSSYPNGFPTPLGESGKIQFATSFTDPAMQTATANIVLMDLNKTTILSNAVTTNVTLGEISDPTEEATSDPTEEATSDPTEEATFDPTAPLFE